MSADPPITPDDARLFVFRGPELLVVPGDGSARVPRAGELALDERWIPVGDIGGATCFAMEAAADAEPPAGMEFHRLRALHPVLAPEEYRMGGRASEMLEWERAHRFCGRCGAATEECGEPFARRCTDCGSLHYPRLQPAVLVSVVRGDEILLARSPHFLPGVYSTLAGFVEPGESLEEAAAREVREEVGVEIAELRYFGSQPWPYPSSLMVAFTAEYAGGELRPDPAEIEDARWFRADALPLVSPPLSLARALIAHFVRSLGGDPATLRSAE